MKMKSKVLYTCEYCHSDYASEKSARECEDCHRKGLKIMSVRYERKGAMPISITVLDNDGFRATYKRVII